MRGAPRLTFPFPRAKLCTQPCTTSDARSARTCRPSRQRCTASASKSLTGQHPSPCHRPAPSHLPSHHTQLSPAPAGMQPGKRKEPLKTSSRGTAPAMPACACAPRDGSSRRSWGEWAPTPKPWRPGASVPSFQLRRTLARMLSSARHKLCSASHGGGSGTDHPRAGTPQPWDPR